MSRNFFFAQKSGNFSSKSENFFSKLRRLTHFLIKNNANLKENNTIWCWQHSFLYANHLFNLVRTVYQSIVWLRNNCTIALLLGDIWPGAYISRWSMNCVNLRSCTCEKCHNIDIPKPQYSDTSIMWLVNTPTLWRKLWHTNLSCDVNFIYHLITQFWNCNKFQ